MKSRECYKSLIALHFFHSNAVNVAPLIILVPFSEEMEFVEVIVLSSFDLIWILSTLTVDGAGYIGWVVFVLVQYLRRNY